MENIRIFYLKICHFLVVKFSVYLNRRVFVMKRNSYLILFLSGAVAFVYKYVVVGTQ